MVTSSSPRRSKRVRHVCLCGVDAAVKELKALGIKAGVVSNADPRICRSPMGLNADQIVKTLEALGILPLLSYPPILSWDVEAAKPSSEIFEQACEVCEEEPGQAVMMVGDELKAYVPICFHLPGSQSSDYHGAMSVGLEARLIRRVGEWSDGAARHAQEDLSGIQTIQSLKDVVDEIRRRNGLS
jgi:FMN phosphatase YigB (HAD superfamily)